MDLARKNKLAEKPFGWTKQDRAIRQVKLGGLRRVDCLFCFCIAAYNLLWLTKLVPIPTAA